MHRISADDRQAIEVVTAIQRGDVETLERHLRDRPGLAASRILDACGTARTLLHVAADWPGHFPNGSRTVALLVAAGAEVNAAVISPKPNGSSETALHWAASSDDVDVLEALLDGGADIESPGAVFTGGTAMSDAVIFAQWRAARKLLERGATTTLWQAAALGLLDRVQQFCLGTPPLPEQVTNALWHACRGGQSEVAEYLVGRGANVNWIGHDRKTPLDVAQESHAGELAGWLQSVGAKKARELS